MPIYLFPKYTRAGASSRYRSFQYLTALEASGLDFTVNPLFDDIYLSYKYSRGRARIRDVLRAFARRLWGVLTVPRASVVVIEYELFPWFPAIFERWLTWRGCHMITDYDDALFHQYDNHHNPLIRRLLGRKIATVMRLSNYVVAGNAYLADYAQRAKVYRVELIPTVIDLTRYQIKNWLCESKPLIIGWIGSPSTSRYLRNIAPALEEVCRDGRARVRLVGSGPIDLPGVPLEVITWSDVAEVDEIKRFDIGIMPLPDEPWTRGKCGFKLIQYMACGLPVVASPVGVNNEIVTNDVNGYLATTNLEWVKAMQKLIIDTNLRRRMGNEGRQRVENQYCLQVTAPHWVDLLQSVSLHS